MSRNKRDSQVITIAGGQRIGLAEYGVLDGIPVLALHGTPASRLMFDVADEPACRLGISLYCPERPGYGLSDRVSERASPFALSRRVDEVIEVVDALGLERFAVVGVSGGAPYAVALCCRLGERIAALGLVSPMGPMFDLPPQVSSSIRAHHRWLFGAATKRPRVLRFWARLCAGLFKIAPGLFSSVFARALGDVDHKVLSKEFARNSLISMTREALAGGVGGALCDLGVFGQPWGVDFQALSCPTILWTGRQDRLVPVASSVWLGQQLPGCAIVTLEGAGHFWVYENIGDVLARVVELANFSGE